MRMTRHSGVGSRCRRLGTAVAFCALVLLLAVGFGTPAFADCTDNDGDGYGNPARGAWKTPQLDCNDSDDSIHPGASETCNGIDDNCDGAVDEGFSVGGDCQIGDPGGCSAGDPGGCCLSAGKIACKNDHTGTFCDSQGKDILHQQAEGPAPNASCFDGKDNDCDGLTDHQEPSCQTAELCNGFDDDNNGSVDDTFPNKGKPCSAGTGSCAASGVYVCSSDQLSTVCTAVALSPGTENTPGEDRCVDGDDNDCDGLTDLADPGCQTPEKCDGQDNDGDGLVDETFPTLGASCSAGQGACQTSGVKVCDVTDPFRQTVTGTATAGSPVNESIGSANCADGIDNDCDGLTDAADPDCHASTLQAMCALPYITGVFGNDCTGKHRIVAFSTGGSASPVLTAEFLALDQSGNILATLPVKAGDQAHLKSMIDPSQYQFVTKKSGQVTTHT